MSETPDDADDAADDPDDTDARRQRLFARWPAENPTRRRERDAEGRTFAEIVDEEMEIEAQTLEALKDM